MAITPARINGQLVETSQEELQTLAKDQGLPAPPTTPVQAAAIGANPDQVKMVGSGQQKQAAINIGLKPDTTLARAKRVEAPREELTAAEATEAQRQQTLAKLTKVDSSLQTLIEQQMAAMAAPVQQTPTWNQGQFDTVAANVNQDELKTKLTRYHQLLQSAVAGDPAVSQELAEIQADLQNTYNITNPQDYFDLSKDTVAAAGAQQMVNPDQVTLGSLNIADMGYTPEELSSTLGADWANLTVPQLQQRVEEIRQAEFTRIDGLKASLATMPAGSAQREAIVRELRDLAQVGIYGVEEKAKEISKQIDEARTVKIGDSEYKIDEILRDDDFSQLISRYLNPDESDEFKKELEAQIPAFTKWIQENADGLDAMRKQMELSGIAFGEIQEGQQKLSEEAGLSPDVMKVLVPGYGEATAEVTNLDDNGIYQAAISDEHLANKLNGNADVVPSLKDLSADEIKAASEAGDAITEDSDLAAILGIDATAFVMDPALITKITETKGLLAKVRTNVTAEGYLNDPVFKKLISDGELNIDNIDDFISRPEVFDQYKDYTDKMRQIEDIEDGGDIQDAINFMMGVDPTDVTADQVTLESLNKTYKDLKLAYQTDPESERGKKYQWMRENLDPDKSGKIGDTKEDKRSLMEKMKSYLEEGKSFGDMAGGKYSIAGLGKDLDANREAALGVPSASTLETKIRAFFTDKKVEDDELQTLTTAELKALPEVAWKRSGYKNYEEYRGKVRKDGQTKAVNMQLDAFFKTSGLTTSKAIKNLFKNPNAGGDETTRDANEKVLKKLKQDLASYKKGKANPMIDEYLAKIDKALGMIKRNRKYHKADKEQKEGVEAALDFDFDFNNGRGGLS